MGGGWKGRMVMGMSGGCRSKEHPGAGQVNTQLIPQHIAHRSFASLEPHVVVAMSICKLKSAVRISCSHQHNPRYNRCFSAVAGIILDFREVGRRGS